MLILAIVVASIIAYLAIGAWTLGYVAEAWDYRDYSGEIDPWRDPGPPVAAFFWPISLVIIVLRPMLAFMFKMGSRRSEKEKQLVKFRVKAEERLRIEQARLEEEVEKEIEETLRNTSKR